MTAAAMRRGPDGVRPLDVLLSTVALFALAVAQPLLDLLGRNAEFFLARASPAVDIITVSLLVAIAMPLALGLLSVGAHRLGASLGRAVHGTILTGLGALLVLQVVQRTPLSALPGWIEIVLALLVGGLVAVGFYRSDTLRSVMDVAAFAPVAVIGLFLFASSATQLVFAAPALAQPVQLAVNNPAPVVMVVFDEFPVASLMDEHGEVQRNLYPNFARLADDGTWFRNAVTVQQQTEASLPAMLTGNDGVSGRLPVAGDYPANLFTLLADAYDIRAIEAVTELCPEYACENGTRPTLEAGARWRSLIDDLRIVAGHVLLPDDVANRLPPIDQSWSNFDGSYEDRPDFDIIERFRAREAEDRRVPVERFVDSIEPGRAPTLYFLHALLPHLPWNYVATGQAYEVPSPHPASIPLGWGDDEWLVDQAYQGHLIQVQYVDGIVGQVIDRLEQAGLYEDALIVIASDHGITVRPSVPHRRVVTEDTVGDIAAVPLFVKRPGNEHSGPSDYRATTLDVVPTIADVLGIDLPWSTEGVSLFADDLPVRTQSRITGDEGPIDFGTDGSEARALATRKIARFGSDGPYGLAPPGQSDLLGLRIEDLTISSSEVAAAIDRPDRFADVDTDGDRLPVAVEGTVWSAGELADPVVLAVAVNGEVAAVTRTYSNDQGVIRFFVLLPPAALVDGNNTLDLIVVEGEGSTRTFAATQ